MTASPLKKQYPNRKNSLPMSRNRKKQRQNRLRLKNGGAIPTIRCFNTVKQKNILTRTALYTIRLKRCGGFCSPLNRDTSMRSTVSASCIFWVME